MKNEIKKIYIRDFFTCQKCGYKGDVAKLSCAHRIKQGKGTEKYIYNYVLKKYKIELKKKEILKIIHDPDNLVIACRGNCNDNFNIFFNNKKRDKLLEKILKKYVNNEKFEVNKNEYE